MLSRVVLRSRWTCNYIRNSFFLNLRHLTEKASYRPLTDFLKDVDAKDLQPKYSQITELKNADDRLKKIFTIEYGTPNDIAEKKRLDLINTITDSNSNRWHTVTEIVDLTLHIKFMQEKFFEKPHKFQSYRKRIFVEVEKRRKALDNLRDSNYEVYAKVVDLLNLKHTFEPQYEIKPSHLAEKVAQMRISAFAESRRLIAAKQKRISKLTELKDKFKGNLMKIDSLSES